MSSYPNQNVILINQSKAEPFLKIGDNEWREAYKKLKPSAFAIYLYLANNKDGFRFALSQKAIENDLGIKKTAYHTAVNSLKEEGYIYTNERGLLCFSPSPQKRTNLSAKTNSTDESAKTNLEVHKNEHEGSQKRTNEFAKTNLEVRKNDREIDIDKIDKIDKKDKAPAPQAAQTPPTQNFPKEISQSQINLLNQLDEDMDSIFEGKIYDNSLYQRYKFS